MAGEETPLFVLKKYFGYSSFRSGQEEIVQSVLAGHDTLALMPTGGGKSITFQIPALMHEGICLVITPLVALMKDQVEQLKQKEIKALAIHSGMSLREIDVALDNCVYGQVKFLYVSPERLKSDLFLARLQKMQVSLLVVDEAHCISEWGYDFRPAYLEIGNFRSHLEGVPVLALTASATPEVADDIVVRLELKQPQIFKRSFIRENLSYSVREVEDKEAKLLEILHQIKGSAIVYVPTRKLSHEIADFLQKNRISATYYHGGLDPVARDKRQDQWVRNQRRVMVATNAFGMGINKSDVRLVIHYQSPSSLESYYQEAGRAGRDGERSYAVLLTHAHDREVLQEQLQQSHPNLEFLAEIYQQLANYFQLAIGSGELASFEFDLSEFCKRYRQERLLTFHALRKLEEEGLVQFNDSFYRPSMIHIPLEPRDLYKFQVANEAFDPFLKGLLRLYGGDVFANFVTFDEKRLARFTELSLEEINRALFQLNKREILVYLPLTDKPRITFLTERKDARKLPISKARIKKRYEVTRRKLEAIIQYYEQDQRCRQQILVEYFGQLQSVPCGICDVCLRHKREQKEEEHHLQLTRKIIATLETSPGMGIEDLAITLKMEKEEVLPAIRWLLNEGKIRRIDGDKLQLA